MDPNDTKYPASTSGKATSGPQMKLGQLHLPFLEDVMIPSSDSKDGIDNLNSLRSKDLQGSHVPSANSAMTKTTISMAKFESNLNLRTGEDSITFFARHGNNTPVKFVYCNRADTGDDFRPYDLVIVNRKQVNMKEHFTISSTGVVHVLLNKPAEFITLADWMHQSNSYNTLRSIRFFKDYLIAKMFRLWRSNVRYRKYFKKKNLLAQRLFLARPSFCTPLIEVNRLLYDLENIELSDTRVEESGAESFKKSQTHQRDEASKKIEAVIVKLDIRVEMVIKGVKERARAYDHGIASDDLSNSRFAQHLIGGNGKAQSMVAMKKEREERIERLKHAAKEKDMLGHFIRLVDYMEVVKLVGITIKNAVTFLSVLLSQRKAMFVTHLNFAPTSLEFKPDVEMIHKVIDSMIEGTISSAHTVDRIIQLPKFKPVLSNSLSDIKNIPKVDLIIHSDRLFKRTVENITRKVNEDFKLAVDTISFLEKHRPVYEYGNAWDFKSYCEAGHDVSMIKKDMAQQVEWQNEIRRIRDQYDSGIFQVETRGLKDTLTPFTEAALAGMKENLLTVFQQQCNELKELFKQKIKQLDENPDMLQQYAAHVENYGLIEKEGIVMGERSKTIEMMFSLLVEYDVNIPSADAVSHDDLKSSLVEFGQMLQVSKKRIDGKMMKMTQTVISNIARLNRLLDEQKKALQEGIFQNEKESPKNVLKVLDGVNETLQEINKQTKTLQRYQVLFNDEPYAFGAMTKTMEVYDKTRLFWSTFRDWEVETKAWETDDFSTIDVEAMNIEVNDKFQFAFQANKEAKNSAVAKRLKDSVFEWKQLMPMILLLGSKAMKKQHWAELFKLVHQGGGFLSKIQIGKLKKFGIFSYKHHIQTVAEQANGEYDLEQALQKIRTAWEQQSFNVVPSQKAKDAYILGDVDDISNMLEDHQVNLQQMLASRHIAAVQDEVLHWDRKMSDMSDILDEWLLCQRNWMYLEPIFTAPDIQRQLPAEANMFGDVDRFWRDLMRKMNKSPNVLQAMNAQNLLNNLRKYNFELEKIQKHLEEYLETKRAAFPRFYFLSNDELLAILSQARRPQAVKPHLQKCFENIASLTFTEEQNSKEVVAMVSSEGEEIPFVKHIICTGNTEDWLIEVEEQMRQTIRKSIYDSMIDYPDGKIDRADWLSKWPCQSILTVDQMFWTHGAEKALRELENGTDKDAMKTFLDFTKEQISAMVLIVRGNLNKLQRQMMSALIVLDVHGRDVVQQLVDNETSSTSHFEWSKQLRYYWEAHSVSKFNNVDEEERIMSEVPIDEDCFVRQTSGNFDYRYEYLGLVQRLVITPLTDRCYLTLTGALSLGYGGSPNGPAGTGKTETVKDLGKAMANQVVVFNCSEGLKVKMMSRFFSGLAQAGAWACFDEFNRIDIEVLSVVAQQILTIQNAITSGRDPFEFDGRMMPLDKHFGVFITMNPGYAGRTELPDNLKALFRPVAMMVPDYALIAQIILFSEGFQTATSLSKKMVQLYKLSSEQLSKQDHYDFGMRAVKAVLVMAGALKRKDPDLGEDVVLIRAMNDSNVPKFLADDLPLFQGIVSDLFPQVIIPSVDRQILEKAICDQLIARNLLTLPIIVSKVIQLYETMLVRHGVMVVGNTMSGKSVIGNVLASALSQLAEEGYEGQYFNHVEQFIANPKAITMEELYGFYNPLSMDWKDGLIAHMVREASEDQDKTSRKWITFDGPVDSLWIENMNTVLDDNKMLCLANSERIKLPNSISMLFEVQDLAVASPATVSRCGMVYLESQNLGWKPILKSWKNATFNHIITDEKHANAIINVLQDHIQNILDFVDNECKQIIPAVPAQLVQGCLHLMEAFLTKVNDKKEVKQDAELYHKAVSMYTFLSIVWSFGANLVQESREKFSQFARNIFSNFVELPIVGDVHSFCIDDDTMQFVHWDIKVQPYKYDPSVAFHSILVPTPDTTRLSYFVEHLVSMQRNVLVMGPTGVGKTVVVEDYMLQVGGEEEDGKIFVTVPTIFSARTASKNLQDMFENKLHQKRKNLLGAPIGKKIMIFIDDINMPQPEKFGAQPPLELLRQTIDQGGFYDRNTLLFKRIQDTVFVAACAEPGGGRNEMPQRLTRHFHMLWQPNLNNSSMKQIFSGILTGFLNDVCSDWKNENINDIANAIVDASVVMYTNVAKKMLPTPAKSHYTFNLRDLAKVIHGVTQIEKNNLPDLNSLLRLWTHESARVFRDRLVDDKDRGWYNNIWASRLEETFKVKWEVDDFKDILFSDVFDSSNREYQEINKSQEEISTLLETMLEEYNQLFPTTMDLVFFSDAIHHLCRVARIIRSPRGNALLVGVGGSGRNSLTRLACFIGGFTPYTMAITRGFSQVEWREGLKKMLMMTGIDEQHVCFLFSDTQIIDESFLEDINNLLNSGEIPNLFEDEELDIIIDRLRETVRELGHFPSKNNIMTYFTTQVRSNLHIVLSFSPIGDSFRSRCRQYLSLVNCCTIDWYNLWPSDALYSVAKRFLNDDSLGISQYQDELCQLCVTIHSSVAAATSRYYEELRRYNYATPTSYLELIRMYTSLLALKQDEVSKNVDRFKNGLSMIQNTNDLVSDLQANLVKLQPILKKNSEELSKLLVQLEIDSKDAHEMALVCQAEAKQTAQTTSKVQDIRDACDRDLAEATPIYEAAIKALNTVTKSDITNVKSFLHPPALVVKVMEAVCVLFEEKPDWNTGKRLLLQNNFLESCMNYDKDNIPSRVLKKVAKYIKDPDFIPEKLESVSQACVGLCMWVIALDTYSHVAKAIAPKRQALREAEEALEVAQATLAEKQMSLNIVQARVAELQATADSKKKELDDIKNNIGRSEKQLVRAKKLLFGLSSEEKRWKIKFEALQGDLVNVIGNMMLAAGFISYCGPFTTQYRDSLLHIWQEKCINLRIPVDKEFKFIRVMSDPIQVRQWRIMGLPADQFSIQNGIISSEGRRWPLMIDPQQQANRWIKNLYKKHNLQCLKLNDNNYLRTLDNAIRFGQPALLEDVDERLDADIEPVLLKQTFKKGGQLLLRLNETDVPYSQDFKFFITTKLANPHYLPEIFVKVTIVNFTVTQHGLTDQLLVVVCSMERPDLEEKNDRLTLQIATDQEELHSIESKILKMLSEATGFILDDEELIGTLASSRDTSDKINNRLDEAQTIMTEIAQVRNEYRNIAERASILYFVVAQMALVDPMYQYSLQYFTQLICRRIEQTRDINNNNNDNIDEKTKLTERLNVLMNDFTHSVYTKICAGLFEKDKLLFSFLIACNIARISGDISQEEWEFFLRGPDTAIRANISKPNPVTSWLSSEKWLDINASIPIIKEIVPHLEDNNKSNIWKYYYESFSSSEHHLGFDLPEPYNNTMTPFQKLLMIKTLHGEKLIIACKNYIETFLKSKDFIRSPPFDLENVYESSNNSTPIIFVLSPGADPIQYLVKLAQDHNREDQLRIMSLGQDQGPLAAELMDVGRKEGAWICLQNCHLSTSWLPELEKLLDEYEHKQEECHDDYRLFLTSMPTSGFPVSVLQRGVKITNEPPKGLSNNLMRTFLDVTEEEYEYCSYSESEIVQSKSESYKKLLFGLAFFHAVIQERRKFGSVGWNIPYEWMNSDLEVSKKQLKMYICDSQDGDIPYRTLRELIGDINYCGRVTDDKDSKLVRSLLSRFFSSRVLNDDFTFIDNDDTYCIPKHSSLNDVREYINTLPDMESPEVFGLHSNADITFQLKESNSLLEGLVNIQPKTSGTGGANSSDEIVDATCERILNTMPKCIDKKLAHKSTFAGMLQGKNTLGVFLGQEVDRFNKLIKIVQSSLTDVCKAITGVVVMSNKLETLYNSILFNRVPELWHSVAYPSLKNLANWFDDLLARYNFINDWIINGAPKAFWISGFFFPQGFLTAVLQKYARQTLLPIDTLRFRTNVTSWKNANDVVDIPEKGAYMYGHYLQGADWDYETNTLVESTSGVLFIPMPVIHLDPETVDTILPDKLYECPVYTTSERKGVLSTTGHSTNFVQYAQLPSYLPPDHWIRRGCALLLQLDP